MRTLVISDLHLGARAGRDLLRDPDPIAKLCAAAAAHDRLVLLGDLLELRRGPLRDTMAAAEPAMRALGEAMGAGGEVVLTVGNHDHGLLRGWFERRDLDGGGGPLGLETEVQWEPGGPLATLAQWLSPARVRAAYPGIWLREDVYAIHGHYGDRHSTVPMLERLGAGFMSRVAGDVDGGPRRAEDYEAMLAPLYAWIDAAAQRGSPPAQGASARAWLALSGATRTSRLRWLGMQSGFGAAVAAINRIGLGPVRRDLSGPELRRAGLRAFGEVVSRLGVEASWVLFGHTHRAGPLPGDDVAEWRNPTGARLINTGCWVDEPNFLGPRPQQSPYRAGFAVALSDDATEPELVNLLD